MKNEVKYIPTTVLISQLRSLATITNNGNHNSADTIYALAKFKDSCDLQELIIEAADRLKRQIGSW